MGKINTSKDYKPSHGGYPGVVTVGVDPAAPGADHTNYHAVKATTPSVSCPCGQVPVCHGLRTCGMKSA